MDVAIFTSFQSKSQGVRSDTPLTLLLIAREIQECPVKVVLEERSENVVVRVMREFHPHSNYYAIFT